MKGRQVGRNPGETWTSANKRMACLQCGESGAQPYQTTRGENPGRYVRVCARCAPEWVEFGLRERPPMYDEPAKPREDGAEEGQRSRA